MRALMRRAYSIYEMKRALEHKAERGDLVPPVLAKLRERNYLDDARFARTFARQRATHRSQGRYRIARELRARGVADKYIEAACDEAFDESNEEEMLKKRLERKLKLIRGPLDMRKRASLQNNLLRSGFSSDMIRRAMRGIASGTAPGDDMELVDLETSGDE